MLFQQFHVIMYNMFSFNLLTDHFCRKSFPTDWIQCLSSSFSLIFQCFQIIRLLNAQCFQEISKTAIYWEESIRSGYTEFSIEEGYEKHWIYLLHTFPADWQQKLAIDSFVEPIQNFRKSSFYRQYKIMWNYCVVKKSAKLFRRVRGRLWHHHEIMRLKETLTTSVLR